MSRPTNTPAWEASLGQRLTAIPQRALLLSLVTLAVPVVGAAFAPDLLREDTGLLLWLTPILPAFLLAYYRGWRGVTGVLALGMASITAANLVFALSDVAAPPWSTMFTLVVVYLVITNGVGALAELLHRERRAAERVALTDPLTGLANRRYCDLHLPRAFAAAVRGAELAVVMFDLDRFKRVNDTFGHAVGDDVIRAMGEVLNRNTRGMDLPARFGGEEFLIVLSSIEAEEAMSFADRVRVDLRSLDLPCGTVTVSAGVAAYEAGMGSPEVLIAAADRALYQAKASGRDRAVLATVDSSPTGRPDIEHIRSASRGPKTVLVVDDEVAVLAPLTRLVERMGYTAKSAQSGRAALAFFEGSGAAPDVLLTDVMMPDMNGLVLVDELTTRGHHIPVIYMSGQIQTQVTWPGISGDVAGFLQKPIEAEDLAAALRQALGDGPSARRRLDQLVAQAGQATVFPSAPATHRGLEVGAR